MLHRKSHKKQQFVCVTTTTTMWHQFRWNLEKKIQDEIV